MKLTIFGATGGVGLQLVGQAIAAGHDVRTNVRHGLFISRADVAHYMLRAVGSPRPSDRPSASPTMVPRRAAGVCVGHDRLAG
jgi:hypothetical protein